MDACFGYCVRIIRWIQKLEFIHVDATYIASHRENTHVDISCILCIEKSKDIIWRGPHPFSRKDYESGNDMNKINWYISNASAPLAMADPTNHHFHNLKKPLKRRWGQWAKKTGNQNMEPFAVSIGLFQNWKLPWKIVPFCLWRFLVELVPLVSKAGDWISWRSAAFLNCSHFFESVN